MKIYLDTANFIDLLERGRAGIDPEEFRQLIASRNHTLVLSFPLIMELIQPMWEPNSQTVVTRTLNQIENFPHEWIDLVHLPNLEVKTALACFRQGNNYPLLKPYVDNLASTMVNPPKQLKLMMHYPLAEAAFDLRNSGSFHPDEKRELYFATYRDLMGRERELLAALKDKHSARKALFIEKVEQRIIRDRLFEAGHEGNGELFREVAEHIHNRPDWCPSLRLQFEVFHSVAEEVGDQLDEGDIWDFAHVQALPYVDFLTTDKRIATHVERISRRLGTAYHEKIRPNIARLIDSL